jgi:adenine/guanine phosphoribosyltransferase-like PRPP-binding protein
METDKPMDHIRNAFDNRPLKEIEGNKYLVNTLTDHVPATPPEFVQQVTEEFLALTDFSACDKIIGDEERGGYITAITAFLAKKPFALVKWNPAGVEGEVSVDFKSAYAMGALYLNSVQKGDKIIIVEDFIDTGGTMIAMIKLLQKIGAEIIDVLAVVEKIDYEAHERILKETGISPKVLVSVSVAGVTSRVVHRLESK